MPALRMRIQTSVPAATTQFEALRQFGERLGKMSGGRLKVDALPVGAVVGLTEILGIGPEAFGWFKAPIKNMADFRKLRTPPGLPGEIYRELGIAAVSLPGPEIPPAATIRILAFSLSIGRVVGWLVVPLMGVLVYEVVSRTFFLRRPAPRAEVSRRGCTPELQIV